MKMLLMKLSLFFCFFLVSPVGALDLTEEEQLFITLNPEVKVAMMSDFTPFSYKVESTPVGFEHGLLNIISEKTGLYFDKKYGSWTNSLKSFKEKDADIITSISYKKDREPYTTFTSPYYEIPIMIFVRDDFGEYLGLESLENKKVGVLKDVFYLKELEKNKKMNLVYYETYEELTRDLVFGKVDVLIQNLTNVNYLIKKNSYSNIKLVSELNIEDIKKEDLRFGVQKEKPLLSSILQKALDSITEKEKEELVNKWIGSIKEYAGGHIELSAYEVAYLDKKTIRYCINPTGLPLEGYNEKGEHVGMSSDYYRLFEVMLSAKFELVKTNNWNDSVNHIKQEKCDMLALAMETHDRKDYLNFTNHYLSVPLVVATRVGGPFINDTLDLEGKKIGIIAGDSFVEILRQKYPSLTLVEVTNISEGLDMVKEGELFGYIDTLASIGYEFQSEYFGELKIAGKISEDLNLSVAVIKKDEVLLNILQKTVSSLSNEFHREVFSKWVPVNYVKNNNYALFLKIFFGSISLIALIFLLVYYWKMSLVKVSAKAKEDFLVVMSHELRTPMNAIVGLSALLKFSETGTTQKKYIDKLEISCGYMMQLVNNVLDFSKVKSDGFVLQKKNFHLEIALYSVKNLLEQQADIKGLNLILSDETFLEKAIIGDRDHLSQILVNLVSNAIKYTDDGEVSLIVKQLEATTKNTVRLEFNVFDTGIGIAPENTKTLFDPYQRVVNSEAAFNEGVGLGLAISKSLVELMGGNLQVESLLGEGSRFYFDLIFEVAEDYTVFPKLDAITLNNFSLPKGIKILLTDDEPLNRYVVSEMIKNMGGEVSLTTTGENAIIQLQKNTYDIVLMDINLPGKTGLEVCRWIRKHGVNPNIPIIALTAHEVTWVEQKCQEVGMNGSLSKPLKYQDLYYAIYDAIEGKTHLE